MHTPAEESEGPSDAGRSIRVDGIVQGVGFRPFVYRLAVGHGLAGDVRNDSRGLTIRVFGGRRDIERFVAELTEAPPPLASVSSVTTRELPFEPREGFCILASEAQPERTVAVTPDAAICPDCLRELLDPEDRRYRYPFINCTNCGPRYSIIEDVPYDRPNTTMRDFEMCAPCRTEYEDPADRRYHAQPVCCDVCGPELAMLDAAGNAIDCEPVAFARQQLLSGRIVAIKGLGGFHLACDATNEGAVERLRRRKHREEKPLAVMAASYELAERLIEMPDYGKALLESPVAPILIARKRSRDVLAPSVSAVTDFYGVMLPYTPLHVLLFERDLEALVMTSGNLTDEPIAIDNDEAIERLAGVADFFLVHNRRIHLRLDDSVVSATGPSPIIWRRARGYVPRGIETGRNVHGVAAFGPLLKNTLAIGRGTVIYPGQHVGDLDNLLARDMFDEVYRHLRDVLDVDVETIACDLHPDYPTTRIAQESGKPVVQIQHHFAHVVSLMAEKRVYDRSIGFSFDGTGYGDDGAIWGGEVFVFDPASYVRAFHLEYVPLPGGDKAIKEPWRMALAYLFQHGLDHEKYVRHGRAGQILALLESDLDVFWTSSMGRLFDAVSSLCGVCQETTFDGKAAMALEGIIADTEESYDFAVADGVIKTGGLIRDVLGDIDRGESPSVISARFHNTIVEIMVECAKRLRISDGLRNVFLSGGCFMNSYLTSHGARRLEEEGFTVFTHTLLPPNDGGVSTGQLLAATLATRHQPLKTKHP